MQSYHAPLCIFALKSTVELGTGIARSLGQPLASHEERTFEDGEHKSRPLESVEGNDVYVIQSLHGGGSETTNDKLCRMLFFIGALKDAGAARVTAIVPYLCYARKDRRTKSRDVDYVRGKYAEKLCVVSPDPGGVKRAELFREALETSCGSAVGKGFVDKHRSAGVLTGDIFAGDTNGATALIIDDLTSTGHTLLRAARAARNAGARKVIALVTHGLFQPESADVVQDPAIDRFVIADSVPLVHVGEAARGKIDVLPCADLVAEAIRRLRAGRALDDLLAF